MMIVKKNNFTYYFKNESITLVIPQSERLGDQCVSFNCFSLQSRKKFQKFSKELYESSPKEFDSINEVYGLARKHDIRATNGHKPTFVADIAF